MVGLGKAARAGILVRGGNTLERLATTQTAVFDKTGTLTTGAFSVQAIKTFGVTEPEVKAHLLALERHSSHPIARALVQAFVDATPTELTEVTEKRGMGISGRSAGGELLEVRSSNGFAEQRGDGIVLLKDGTVIAHIQIADAPRADAQEAIKELTNLGIRSTLLSGDSRSKCEQLAATVGIQSVEAEKRPEEKLSIISDLEAKHPVIFIGDGINDAPALSRATVGVSLSDATQVAVQAAQVVILGGKLQQIPSAIRIARGTVSTIRQNLFWAFLYNVLAIPIAAAGYLSPMVGALAMAFSDLIVIGNSIRFRLSKT
jgi:Cu+-exporting ATPase